MRLDKYLCHALAISRKEAHHILSSRKVIVNDQVCTRKDAIIDEEKDKICFEGKQIQFRLFHYIMLNKPQGVVSALKDNLYPTINQVIADKRDLHPIGRLDKDTEGLIIMTNNGALTHDLTNPNKDVTKTYLVYLQSPIEQEYTKKLKEGLDLFDGKGRPYHTKPATLTKLEEKKCLIEITEGKYHQVKKMFLKLGNEVIYLKRLAIGPILLDESLEVGQHRDLTDEEIALLKGIL